MDIDPESEEVWEAAGDSSQGDSKWNHYGVESFSCIRLMATARASIESGAAIVFC